MTILRKTTVTAAILATATALAACGGSSPTNTGSTKLAADNGLKLAECMRSHGVPDYPDPGSGGNQVQASQGSSGNGSVSVDGVQLNVSPRTLQKAMGECQKNLPHGPPISGAQLAKIQQGALKMAQCMRSHGVPNFPDPQVTSGPNGAGVAVRIGGVPNAGLDPNSPAFKKAQRTCMPLIQNQLKKGK